MKKVTKATIAAAAAGVLLLGGAGTIAKWSATKDINAGTVTTGHLKLDATEPGTWTDTSSDAATTEFNPAEDRLVPGDTVVFNQTVKIEADGKNLKGELTASELTGVEELPADLSVVVEVDGSAQGLVQDSDTGVITFATAGDYTVPVTVTVTFDKAATGSMDAPVDLGSMALTLNQVRD